MEYPVIVINDSDTPNIPDLNLQIDDVGKTFELECKVRMEELKQTLINNTTPTHRYVFKLVSVEKFQEEL